MLRKIVFSALLALQFAAVANLASSANLKPAPAPSCFPCPDAR